MSDSRGCTIKGFGCSSINAIRQGSKLTLVPSYLCDLGQVEKRHHLKAPAVLYGQKTKTVSQRMHPVP